MATHLRVSRVVVELEGVHPEKLFAPGHEVWNFCNQVRRDLVIATKASAPPTVSKARWTARGSTGNLQRAIHGNFARTGPESIDMSCESPAPYTMWVHGGTAFKRGQGYIYSREGFANRATVDALALSGFHAGTPGQHIPGNLKGLFMVLPTFGGQRGGRGLFTKGQSERLKLRVRGQRANPFLVRGMNLAALKHSCLGPPWTGVVGL